MKSNTPHILCVNPWIHDFAAFDFWAKPLGLLTIASILRDRGLAVSYIDCQDRFHPKETGPVKVQWDGRGPFRKTPVKPPVDLEDTGRVFYRYGIKPEWFDDDLRQIPKPDLVFVTSQMTYWASGVRETIERIKSVHSDIPVVLGGIYASLCFEHALEQSHADHVVKGPAEPVLGELVRKFTGYEISDAAMSGELDMLPYPALDMASRITYAPVLTSRGCPFSCEYCASSYLEPKLRRRSPSRVFDEILHWHRGFGVKNFPFYDDALLVNGDRYAFPLFEKIIDAGLDLNFHTPNALHVREISQKAADLMLRAGFKTIRLGLETTDFSPHRSHDNKVSGDEFIRAVSHLKKAGFKADQMGAYLLCGLPGQDLDEVEASMKFVKNCGVIPTLAYYTPIPHTAMWETAVRHSRYDLTEHPVFTNNTLFPCVISKAGLARISKLKNLKN